MNGRPHGGKPGDSSPLLQSAAGTTPGFSGFAEQAARRGAIVVLPEGYQFSWNAGVCCGAAVTKQIDDLGFLQRLLSIIQHQFGDQTRPVYVVGFSNGGFMALRLACAGTRLAGIAIVEASLGVARRRPLRPAPYGPLTDSPTRRSDRALPRHETPVGTGSIAAVPFGAIDIPALAFRRGMRRPRHHQRARARRPNRSLSVSSWHARRTRDDARRESRLANPTR